MRVMVLVKGDANTEAGVMPDEKLLEEMTKYNEELVKAGILLDGEGLTPSSQGARVRWTNGKPTVLDGPFTESKEIIAGYWLWQVRSLDEAIEWVKRCPQPTIGEAEIEIRPLFEDADFGEALTPELQERQDRMREQIKSDRQPG